MTIIKRSVGRPIKQNKKETLSLRLPPDIVRWVKSQELSASVIVENALTAYKNDLLFEEQELHAS